MKKRVILISMLLPTLALVIAVAIAAGQDDTYPSSSSTIWDLKDTGSAIQTTQERPPLTNLETSLKVTMNYTIYLPITIKPLELLFSDDFSDPTSGWAVNDTGAVRRRYQNGEYEMVLRNSNWWAGATAPISDLTSYTLEAKVRRLTGAESDYGLIFDFSDWSNFYVYAIDPGAHWYGIIKINNGIVEDIIPITNTPFINPDNDINRLKVERDGEQIDIYVNGHHLAMANSTGFGGSLGAGLYAESGADAPATIRYDDFIVWESTIGSTKSAEFWSPPKRSYASGGSFFARD